jgi:hypothetical protein
MTHSIIKDLQILEDEVVGEMAAGEKSFPQLLKEFWMEYLKPFEPGEKEKILAYQQTQEWKDSLLR